MARLADEEYQAYLVNKMNLEDVINSCLALPESEQTTPFGPDTLVFKVAGKMFAASGIDDIPARVNLKCDPERALELRDRYNSVKEGYHMNKKHWNTIELGGDVPEKFVVEMIEDSYKLVVEGMKKVDKERILGLIDNDKR